MTRLDWPLLLAATLAAAGPSLLAYNVPPSPTFLNQALALSSWGVFAALTALLAPGGNLRHAAHEAAWPLATLGLLMFGVLWSWGPGDLPSGLALSALGMLLATALLVLGGAVARASPRAPQVFTSFCAGWLAAGVAGAGIGIVQVFAPDWVDGVWIARSGLVGRAVGNLRQPNHLSSLLLWSAIAVVPLLETGRLRRGPGWMLFGLLTFAVVLTASRTGVLGIGLLAMWGLLDRRLSPPTRTMLLLSPLLYVVVWLGLAEWAAASQHIFGGARRLAEADLSSSRFGIWANTLELIRQQPWTGVGFGEFNLAWTLTPFPDRPVAFFDHTHNLPLQFAVELGLPLAALVLACLVAALWRAWRLARQAEGETGVALRSGWMMLLLIALHSQLEYPLWYAYFLLPAAWLFGFALGQPAVRPAAAPVGALFAGGLLLAVGGALSLADYASVTRIYALPHDGSSLEQRIAAGERSWLFAHHAAYADATTDDAIAASAPAFSEAPHYLMDTRLTIAWAKALARSGELDKARHLAQRLREFRHADEFFTVCSTHEAGKPQPFQCEAPAHVPSWRDFVR